MIAIVKKVHPDHFYKINISEKAIEQIIKELSKYKKIFTTNYDLILYWIIMKNQDNSDDNFLDFFWNKYNDSRCCFDVNNTKILKFNEGKPRIYYLHGALHLFFDGLKEFKAICNHSDSLMGVLNRETHPPLFISEGSSQEKERRKRKNRKSFTKKQGTPFKASPVTLSTRDK